MILIFGVMLSASVSELNPDWLGYKAMYESNGAWLEEAGRDPLYVTINQFFNHVLGAGAYEEFRWFLAFYFLVYVTLLLSGLVVPLGGKELCYPLFGVALIFLGMLRFTIQIREGIAISLVVLALGLLIRAASILKTAVSKSIGLRALGVSLLLIAPLFHSSTFSIVLVYLTSLWVGRKAGCGQRLKVLWILAFVAAAIFIVQLQFNLFIGAAFNEKGGDREVQGEASLVEQLLRIAFYGVVCVRIWLAAKSSSFIDNVPDSFRSFFLVLTGPAQISCLALIFIATYLGLSKLVVGDLIRQLVMFISMGLLLLSVFGYRSWVLVLASLVLVFDGVRAVIVSVFTTHGVQL